MNSLSPRTKSVFSVSGFEPVQTLKTSFLSTLFLILHVPKKNVSPSFDFDRFNLSRFCLLILLVWTVEASSTNITIDDTNSAFTWGTGWSAGPCDFCAAQLNQSLTFDGTWHDGGSANGSMATLNFDGTAVYLFGITSAAATGTIEFTLDGKSAMTFNGSVDIPALNHVYNFSLFSASGLENTSHTLEFTSILAVNASQTVLVDYAVVTVDNSTDGSSSSGSSSSPSSPSSGGSAGLASGTSHSGSNKAAIIGGTVGGVVGAVLLALALLWFIRRRKPQARPIKPENDIAPFRVPTAREMSLPSTTTISSNPKAGLNRTLPESGEPDITAPSRPRTDSGAGTDATGGPRVEPSPIHEMEQRLRSLESMVILNQALVSGHRGALEGEEPTNPPPPY
ncbi:hypothetical protein BDP27DRAFT_1424316 [Rhodocollybia butyracea]|uniref:Uncharacterized protein n=1 Tax=Rhodocollybia butyracea TaxID=206335 RepID=A0A9P5U5M0_9AGAR|nr:hypothetical protein BDP27DRAFT_1424316 [Rhodocollybia butyracea]